MYFQAQAAEQQRSKECARAAAAGGDHPELDQSDSGLFLPVATHYPNGAHRLVRSSMIDTEESFETQAIDRNRGGFRGVGGAPDAITSPTMAGGDHRCVFAAGVGERTTAIIRHNHHRDVHDDDEERYWQWRRWCVVGDSRLV